MDQMARLLATAEKIWVQSLLNESTDRADCFLEIIAGSGGTESCDWASILLRMYLRWCEASGFRSTQESIAKDPDSRGIHSATIRIEGPLAYGKLKLEAGVHRLVRISPFDAQVTCPHFMS